MPTTMARPRPEEIGGDGPLHCLHCTPEREIEQVEKVGAPLWRHVDTQSSICQVSQLQNVPLDEQQFQMLMRLSFGWDVSPSMALTRALELALEDF